MTAVPGSRGGSSEAEQAPAQALAAHGWAVPASLADRYCCRV